RLVSCMMYRLQTAMTEPANHEAYARAEEFGADLAIMRDSLATHKGERLARLFLDSLVRKLDAFRVHFFTPELRQHWCLHANAAAALSAADQHNAVAALDVLGTLRDAARLQRTYGPTTMRVYIISGTKAPEDVLSFIWLAELGGIDLIHLMPVPLFESIESL